MLTHSHMHTLTYIFTCTHKLTIVTHMLTHSCAHTLIHMFIQAHCHTNAHTHICAHTCSHTCSHTCTHNGAGTHIHIIREEGKDLSRAKEKESQPQMQRSKCCVVTKEQGNSSREYSPPEKPIDFLPGTPEGASWQPWFGPLKPTSRFLASRTLTEIHLFLIPSSL
jgi:hypothetical protein